MIESNLVKHGEISIMNQGKFFRGQRAEPETQIRLEFYIKNLNMDKIKEFLNDSSDPNSVNYGKHMTKIEVDGLTANPDGVEIVDNFINSSNAEIVEKSHSSNRIIAKGSVEVWEKALNCEYYYYVHKDTNDVLVRTPEYYLPENVAEQITMVTGTVEFPVPIHRGPIISKKLTTSLS